MRLHQSYPPSRPEAEEGANQSLPGFLPLSQSTIAPAGGFLLEFAARFRPQIPGLGVLLGRGGPVGCGERPGRVELGPSGLGDLASVQLLGAIAGWSPLGPSCLRYQGQRRQNAWPHSPVANYISLALFSPIYSCWNPDVEPPTSHWKRKGPIPKTDLWTETPEA